MNLSVPMLAELQHEAENTRKILKLVPTDKLDWTPHEKSMTLGKLAAHTADLTGWIPYVMNYPELDLMKISKFFSATSNEELMAHFDEKLAEAKEAIGNATNEQFMEMWTLRRGDHVILTMPKGACLRAMAYNHMVHHRGQMTVYLRLLNIPIPGLYGPSKDDQLAFEAMAASNN